jgi:exonuclease III
MKIITWNINGIRAVCKKGFWQWFETELPDMVCLQEIKADDEVMKKWWTNTLKEFGTSNSNQVIFDKATDSQLSTDIFENLDDISCAIPKATTKSLGPSNSIYQDNNADFNSKKNGHFISEYNIAWHACSIKKGYSGTAIIYKKHLNAQIETGLGVEKFDNEGRTTILKTNNLALINCYYPQGGPERIPFKL